MSKFSKSAELSAHKDKTDFQSVSGYFITGKTEVMQSETRGKWFTLHNQLYKDDDGCIFLVPKNYLSDGYTIPYPLAWLGGGRMDWDIRPAIGHDFECQFHQELLVNLSEEELLKKEIVLECEHHGQKIKICKDIPIEFLSVRKTTFKKVNDKFKRMMQATGNIENWRVNLMRFGVNFNIGWLKIKREKIDLNNIYNFDKTTQCSLR